MRHPRLPRPCCTHWACAARLPHAVYLLHSRHACDHPEGASRPPCGPGLARLCGTHWRDLSSVSWPGLRAPNDCCPPCTCCTVESPLSSVVSCLARRHQTLTLGRQAGRRVPPPPLWTWGPPSHPAQPWQSGFDAWQSNLRGPRVLRPPLASSATVAAGRGSQADAARGEGGDLARVLPVGSACGRRAAGGASLDPAGRSGRTAMEPAAAAGGASLPWALPGPARYGPPGGESGRGGVEGGRGRSAP